jgi:hypothetical protein
MFKRLRNTDVLAFTNAVLFILMCLAVYFRRYLQRAGGANVDEFLFYAVVILTLIAVGWFYLRRVAFPHWVLLLMQVGILAHFAGGLVPVGHGRLYDVVLFGLPFDKYVHALNSFAGGAVIACLMDPPKAHPHMRAVLIVLLVLGAGAGVEIVEYLARNSLSGTGVGDYDNNMQDLIANLVGGLLFIAANAATVWTRRFVARRG